MKLFDATLDLAAFAKGTEDHEVSSVYGNDIICDDMSARFTEFGGGTIWIRSGESEGEFGKINDCAAQRLTTQDVYDLKKGDLITIGSWLEFDTQKLINAVNSVLRFYKILKVNDELVYDPDQVYYDLPEDVLKTEDIRKIRIETRHGSIINHYWRVEDKQLHLYDRYRKRYPEEAKIKIFYVDYHGAVGKDDEIDSQVVPMYLRYMSWLYLCRNLIQGVHKDNLIASDMYNEAKIYERDYGNLPNKRLELKTWTFPQW